MSHTLTMDAEEVARLLRVAPATVPAKVRRLRASGFPAPLPGCPGLWSRAQVEAWLEDPEAGAPAAKPRRAEARLARQREALEARYAGGAA